jgi:DNA-binding NtrC family response regulator
MSGLELLDRVKRSHPELPFIIMTGSTRPHESTDAAGRGAFEYLVKPCDTEEVQRAVANAIRRDDSSSARA